jgi:hypothetical protein
MFEYSPMIIKKKQKNYSSDALSVLSQTLSHNTLKETRLKLLSDFETFFPGDFTKRLETLDGEIINIFARELYSVRNLRNFEKVTFCHLIRVFVIHNKISFFLNLKDQFNQGI